MKVSNPDEPDSLFLHAWLVGADPRLPKKEQAAEARAKWKGNNVQAVTSAVRKHLLPAPMHASSHKYSNQVTRRLLRGREQVAARPVSGLRGRVSSGLWWPGQQFECPRFLSRGGGGGRAPSANGPLIHFQVKGVPAEPLHLPCQEGH